MHADGQRLGQRHDQIPAAVLLDRENRLATGTDVAPECEHRCAWIDARVDQVRFVGLDDEFPGARIAPARRRGPAAAALQRQDQVEHGPSLAGTGDI